MEQQNPGNLWTIDELGRRVSRALDAAVDYPGQSNGQIRAVPDRRTIRYYTTLGLLDGPAAMRGRTALYGRRHLLQVVAIKRLQSRGLALARIQEQLAGLSDSELAKIARLPEAPRKVGSGSAGTGGPPQKSSGDRRRQKFWGTVPAEVTAATPPDTAGERTPGDTTSDDAGAAARGIETPAPAPADGTPPRVTRLAAVALAPGATLLLDTTEPITDEKLARMAAAAAPLLKELKTNGLLPDTTHTQR